MKKYIIALCALGTFVVATAVFADSNVKTETFELPDAESATVASLPSFFIGPQGQVRIINGELVSIGTTTPLVDWVKVWGFTFQVDSSSAQFIPAGVGHSDLHIGDSVNVKGTMSAGNGIILAQKVNVLTDDKFSMASMWQQLQEIFQKVQELKQKVLALV